MINTTILFKVTNLLSIFFCGLIGLFFAFIFTLSIPVKYEASANASLPKIRLNPEAAGKILVDPALLIAKYNLQKNLPKNIYSICTEGDVSPSPAISSPALNSDFDYSLRMTRGLSDQIEINVISSSRERSLGCANAISSFISTFSWKFHDEYINDLNAKLALLKEENILIRNKLQSLDKSPILTGALLLTYITDLEKNIELQSEINRLIKLNERNINIFSDAFYVKKKSIEREKFHFLIIGYLTGVLLGIGLVFLFGTRINNYFKG